MTSLFVLSLLMLVAAVFVVQLIELDPGYVLISYSHWTMESSIWVALLVLITATFFFYMVISIVLRLFGRHARLRRGLRSQEQTTRGMIAYLGGNWERSRRILSRSAEKSGAPLINYLFAAKASNELGDYSETKALLRKAQGKVSGDSIMVELAQAEIQFQQGHLEECLVTLTRLRQRDSKHPHLLMRLQSVYIGLNDWDGVSGLLPMLRKAKVLEKSDIDALELRCTEQQLKNAISVNGGEAGKSALLSIWQKQSKAVVRNADIVEVYATCLIQVGGEVEAEKLLRDQLGRAWSRPLVALYGRVRGADVSKQLLHGENWLRERNSDAVLLLCLGRLSLQNSQWAKAREYFENSLRFEFSSESCVELGRLLAKMGEYEKSAECLQQSLSSTYNLPELPMPAS